MYTGFMKPNETKILQAILEGQFAIREDLKEVEKKLSAQIKEYANRSCVLPMCLSTLRYIFGIGLVKS